jgi:hypothetical protein
LSFPRNRIEVRAHQKRYNKLGSARNSSIILASVLPAIRKKLQVVRFNQNVKIMHGETITTRLHRNCSKEAIELLLSWFLSTSNSALARGCGRSNKL